MYGGGGMGRGGGFGAIREEKKQFKQGMQGVRAEQYGKAWEVEMKKACCIDPAFCLLAAMCAPCVSYINRVEALHGDMRFYTCCQGLMPCSGRMKEDQCPEVCLCLETFCCFPNSVLATRYLLQDEMQIRDTKCDSCLIQTVIFLQGLACICHIAAMFNPDLREAAQIIDCAAEGVYCSVCACMQTQHRNQIKHRNMNPQVICPMNPINPMLAPPVQVMQAQPNLQFQYPSVTYNQQAGSTPATTNVATGYPVQAPPQQYPKM